MRHGWVRRVAALVAMCSMSLTAGLLPAPASARTGGGTPDAGATIDTHVRPEGTASVGEGIGLAVGADHACAVVSGAVRCWGGNAHGQLGNGTKVGSTKPVTVSGVGTATSVATGDGFSCALLASRQVRCWGEGSNGQLGDGKAKDATRPVKVAGLSTVASIAAGSAHACAVLTSKAVRCWGLNSDGQLGDGTRTRRTKPVAVSGLSGVAVVTLGASHSCAALTSGKARCWGRNTNGQLGDGTHTRRTKPIAVTGLANVASIAAGRAHTCAVVSQGEVRCWGDNSLHQLGDTTTTERPTPVSVSHTGNLGPGYAIASVVAAGADHTCARIQAPWQAICWGDDTTGQRGDGGTSALPVFSYVSQAAGWATIAAGGRTTCGAMAVPDIDCWGANARGQVGDGTKQERHSPRAVRAVTYPVAIEVGEQMGCAVMFGGSQGGPVACWSVLLGLDRAQYLPGMRTALEVESFGGAQTQETPDEHHVCVRIHGGGVRCIGTGGALGDGTSQDRDHFVTVKGITDAVEIAAEGATACARLATGAVKCWGEDLDDRTVVHQSPVTVSAFAGAKAIAVGAWMGCAMAGGTAVCRPVESHRDLGGMSGATAIGAGDRSACARKSGGSVACWSFQNHFGERGDGTVDISDTSKVTTVKNVANATALSMAGGNVCALLVNATVKCWGTQFLGDGTGLATHATAAVAGGGIDKVVSVSTSFGSTCVLRTDHSVWCWGRNGYGELGDGTQTDRRSPVKVRMP